MLEHFQAAPIVALASPTWSPLWIEMPLLVPEVALIVVAAIAMLRARPEDVPSVLMAFGTALGRLVRSFAALLPSRPTSPDSTQKAVERPLSTYDDDKDGE